MTSAKPRALASQRNRPPEKAAFPPRRLAVIAVAAIAVAAAIFALNRGGSPRGNHAMPGADNEDAAAQSREEVGYQSTRPERAPTAADRSTFKLSEISFDGAAAYDYLKRICALGSRTSGTPGMKKQQELLAEHFQKLGAKVERQEFVARHPLDGGRVPMANLIVTWHPDRDERLLLCAHYDTRPIADRETDPRKRRGVFVGANDGASGVALLMELGKAMPKLAGKYGVDFVFFDGEELVYFDPRADDRGAYFLGSGWFAREYRRAPPGHRYIAGVLLDMVADADLQLYQDRYSMSGRETRAIVEEVWAVAKELGVREFIHAQGHNVSDDHIPLNEIAGIPTIDIIDFDFPRPGGLGGGPYWHTLADNPANCSPLSLAKVGWVVQEWLKRRQTK